MTIFDEQAFGALVEQAVEKAVRKVLRKDVVSGVENGGWVPTQQLAKDYAIAQGTIRRWIKDGRIEAMHVGGALRVSRASFERLLTLPPSANGKTLTPEELADRDELRERRSKKA